MGVGHYENFPVASLLSPPRLREAIRSIYAFARTADDIADEGDASPEARLADLARYGEALRAAAAQTTAPAALPWPQVFVPLASAIARHRLPLRLLQDLLDAFEQDVRNPNYDTRADLLEYCRRSANPVGRLLLHLYGIDDAGALRDADAICTALQLINFWQDLSVDIPRGRIYIPLEDSVRHGVMADQLADPAHDAAARALVADLVRWAGETMSRGAGLALHIPGRAGWELRFVVHGGWRIGEKIAHMRFGSFASRPRLHAMDAPLLAWRSLRYSTSQFTPDALG
ncbi:MAG: squalene synthase HpnC [Burkholderiaceae bacterium]